METDIKSIVIIFFHFGAEQKRFLEFFNFLFLIHFFGQQRISASVVIFEILIGVVSFLIGIAQRENRFIDGHHRKNDIEDGNH